MSEELGNASPVESTPTPSGQSDAASDVTSGAESSTEVQAEQTTPVAPKPKAKAQEKKVNLFESEEFRRYQATQARQIQEERQRADALAAQIREQQLKGMSDYEKAQYKAQEAEQKAQALEQQLKMKELEELKRQDMMRLNQRTGIPLDMLEEATSYEEAQDMAMQYLSTQLEMTVEERVAAALEAKKANRTDTGGGQPAPVRTQQQERMAAAIESKNAADYVAALFEE